MCLERYTSKDTTTLRSTADAVRFVGTPVAEVQLLSADLGPGDARTALDSWERPRRETSYSLLCVEPPRCSTRDVIWSLGWPDTVEVPFTNVSGPSLERDWSSVLLHPTPSLCPRVRPSPSPGERGKLSSSVETRPPDYSSTTPPSTRVLSWVGWCVGVAPGRTVGDRSLTFVLLFT